MGADMGAHSIQRSGLFFLFLMVALAWAGEARSAAKALNCTCINCTYAQGRTQTTYTYDANFNASPAGRAAYNAAESAAMAAADAAAVAAMAAASKGAPNCPQPCWAMPLWGLTHGKPFAGEIGRASCRERV